MSVSWYCHRRVWLKVVEVKEVTVLKIPDINATYDTAKILKKEEMNESILQLIKVTLLDSKNTQFKAITDMHIQNSIVSTKCLPVLPIGRQE